MNLRKGIITGIFASHLAGEILHNDHVHPGLPLITSHSSAYASLPSDTSHVHTPEESSLSDPTNTVVAAGVATGRTVEIRTGRAPSNKTDPDRGILLAILQGYRWSDSEASGRVWADGKAKGSGSAGHFRLKDESGKVVFQGDITIPSGGGELTFENNTIVAGGTVRIADLDEPDVAPDCGPASR